MTYYPLQIKAVTYSKLILYCQQNNISLGKLTNELLDNIAETITPNNQNANFTPLITKENLDAISTKLQKQKTEKTKEPDPF